MKLKVLRNISLLSKHFVKQESKRIIYVHLNEIPVKDFKTEVLKNYVCDSMGHVYSTDQRVLTLHI